LNDFNFDFLEKQEFNLKLLIISFLIIGTAIYVGFLIYGNRGLNRLIDLEDTKKVMKQSVNNLKKENVKLQKEYFGLKDIEGDK